ncbi:hypothetical protein [Amphiplicatus metriothermophilus]|uniref:Protease inhibitor Inh n=1 Tax=Amphiplicatus metriothermophilus TaxID=1519374 RepID=A0A239PZ81_9PROT|nr:hypothetical protein [Amphiplicatus metriothermophilus]MBB5518161.1 hypothetical protein [Amphiplicatus metriothermophilus]SNT75323.1 hypothetical protein SAMN06297382_2664 [Amphiplicatus metriothermophilus]
MGGGRAKTGRMRRAIAALALAAGASLSACDGEPDARNQPLEPAVEPGPGAQDGERPTAHQPVYIGVWAAEPALCGVAPGSADPSPVAFTADAFIGYENRCRIANAQEGTEGGYRLDLLCEGEAAPYAETVDVDVGGDMLRLSRADGQETVFVRCPADDRKER